MVTAALPPLYLAQMHQDQVGEAKSLKPNPKAPLLSARSGGLVCRPPAQGHVPGHSPASAHLPKDQWWHRAGLEQGGLLPDGGGRR